MAYNRPWTGSEVEVLLDMYLTGKGLHNIAQTLGRPVTTVKNKVWKLASGYAQNMTCPLSDGSKPTDEIKDDMAPLNRREIQVLEIGLFGDGQRITRDRPVPMTQERMADVLGRSLSVVQDYVKKKRPVTEGFL